MHRFVLMDRFVFRTKLARLLCFIYQRVFCRGKHGFGPRFRSPNISNIERAPLFPYCHQAHGRKVKRSMFMDSSRKKKHCCETTMKSSPTVPFLPSSLPFLPNDRQLEQQLPLLEDSTVGKAHGPLGSRVASLSFLLGAMFRSFLLRLIAVYGQRIRGRRDIAWAMLFTPSRGNVG